MQNIKINTKRYKTRNDLVSYLKKEHLSRGDKVEIEISDNDRFTFQAIVIVAFFAILYVLQKQKERNSFADKILNNLFEKADIEDIEKDIEKEFGVTIEVTHILENVLEERDFWRSVGQQSFQKAYSNDEPDYSDAVVLEPNPKYKL
jgi:hypothetical protein